MLYSRKDLIFRYAVAYATWIVSLLLWVWFMFLSRDAITNLLKIYYYQNSFQHGKAIQFFMQAWIFVTGIIWLILMVLVENYMREGVKKKNLAKRVGKVIAPELVLIFLSDLMLAFSQGFFNLPFLRWLILVLVLAAAIAMLWLAKKGLTRRQPESNLNPG